MEQLSREINDYRREKEKITTEARQRAALFLICGIDLPDMLSATAEERDRITARLQRLIERERIKGAQRHWSYDLNRHIALKQALDRLLTCKSHMDGSDTMIARPPRIAKRRLTAP